MECIVRGQWHLSSKQYVEFEQALANEYQPINKMGAGIGELVNDSLVVISQLTK